MGNSHKINNREAIYCSRCGAKTEWVSFSDGEKLIEKCPSCGKVHFRNSKPCAGGLILRKGKLLLLRRCIEPFLGFWDIPGGFLEEGEHPADGAIREVFEETGLVVEPEKIFGIYMDYYDGEGGGYTINIYYLVNIVSGELRLSEENDTAKWFSIDDLPEKIAFPYHTKKVVEDLRKYYREKER